MYLYQDVNRRPSIIDGYRTAIVDSLGPAGHHIAQSSDLHRLLSSFHRDCPKSSRNLPKWNLSVLNELSKVPFEPMKDTDLKHLTLKAAFLLALASGKRRSEINAWVANKVYNLGQWKKVVLFPSSDFIAKNQLARECSQSVSPVTIQRRQDLVSGAGPEVLFGSNQRPERVSIPHFHLLQERTHLRHQTCYSFFLVETNHSTFL